VEPNPDSVDRALHWLRIESAPSVRLELDRYTSWLETEALEAGGMGPGERIRLTDRHIADSLCFAGGFAPTLPERLLDVGSGVGLPGIPLALAFPGVGVTLLERSARRCGLMRRIVRILGLDNVEILESDIARVHRVFPALTFRASLAPQAAMEQSVRLLDSGGVAVLGLSRSAAPDARTLEREAAARDLFAEVVAIPSGVLDSPAWLLRMAPQ
jgi:16S rRNA (guanine527-N7)-methyltransferase